MTRILERHSRRCWRLSSILLLTAFAGCGPSGPELVEVEGVVRLDQRPLDMALVKFAPEAGGRQSVAMTDDQGRYKLRFTNDRFGAMTGKHRVMITSALPASPDDGLGKPFPGRKELLPKKYNDETELTAEVNSSNRTFDFDLTPKGTGETRQE